MSARGRHRRPRGRRLSSRVRLLLTAAGGAGVTLPLVATGQADAAQPAAAQQAAAQATPAAQPAASPTTYTVASGDTLAAIARNHGVAGGWEELYAANQEVVGADPGLIVPGLELSLPGDAAEAAPEFVAPVDAPMGTPYAQAGSLWSSGYHTGVDFSCPMGSSVRSVAAGEVVAAGYGGAYGNEVVILHADGHYSQYAHLASLSVGVGQSVTPWERRYAIGSTSEP
jgi:murein DD-endopeptidase MepM/ murein hydrolase activator NlpD